MRAVTGYVVGAILAALLGAVLLVAGMLDRDMAHAQEHAVSAEYNEPQQILQDVERYYDYASRLPWIGNGPVNDVRARQAALQYWQKRYVAIVPEVADPVANLPADNVDLQFITANAMYREGLRQAKDKATTDGALDAAINAYATVLRNADRHEDAAYNYEYAVRLKGDFDKGKKKVPPADEAAQAPGKRGHPPSDADQAKYKVYVPLEGDEIDKNTPSKAGKQKPIEKKG
jgi:hypothetical protein